MRIKYMALGFVLALLLLAVLVSTANVLPAAPPDSAQAPGSSIDPSAIATPILARVATVTPKGSQHQWGRPSQSSDCQTQDKLPDTRCTPGALEPNVTVAQICTPGYAHSVRLVTESEKAAIYKAYGISSHRAGEYEIDHLVSLELGGSNDAANLWPELAEPRPGFHEKDKVENYLHEQVCNGSMPLAQAQTLIASDWIAVYKQLP